jgi:hypothetical protein
MLSNCYLDLDAFLGVPPWSEFAGHNLEANSLHGVGLSPLALFCLKKAKKELKQWLNPSRGR